MLEFDARTHSRQKSIEHRLLTIIVLKHRGGLVVVGEVWESEFRRDLGVLGLEVWGGVMV